MIHTRSVIITLALTLLLWPLVAHAAPAAVSGRLTIEPPLPVTGASRARFYLTSLNKDGTLGKDFGSKVYTQQVLSQSLDYNFSIPDINFASGVSYALTVYVDNGTGEARGGWTRVYPSGGTKLDFKTERYTGSLPPDSAGTMALLLGLILAAVAMTLMLWRQVRLRAFSRPSAAV